MQLSSVSHLCRFFLVMLKLKLSGRAKHPTLKVINMVDDPAMRCDDRHALLLYRSTFNIMGVEEHILLFPSFTSAR